MVTVIATIKANPADSAFVQEELQKLIEPTLKEAGCISYELNVDNDDASLFVFVEKWESDAHLDEHLKGEGLREIIGGVKPKTEFIDVARMTDISA